ncbi:hypothetical protein PG994_007271 [Apiospora phragmitis]|uniref:RNA-dependent RNA polymerase n=1 Tax=Apiospora phragmitis TaxID=2905665 RepID=A0ABR1V0B6_9PEZI
MSNRPFEFPIPNFYYTLGLTDDYLLLGAEEVFVRAGGSTIEGPVLVYRNPVIHIGDIQKANAVTETDMRQRVTTQYGEATAEGICKALLSQDNVIFFSQEDQANGKPPLPNRLSGGDLDGDRFEIISLANMDFWGHGLECVDWANYSSEPRHGTEKAWDIPELCDFLAEYVRNDCFDALADQKGMKNDDVKEFSTYISTAVDYAKSGVKVDFEQVTSNPRFRIATKHDFMQKLKGGKVRYDSRSEYYPSEHLLGRLFRARRDALKRLETEKAQRPSIDGVMDNKRLADKVNDAFPPPTAPGGPLDARDLELLVSMEQAVDSSVEQYAKIYREYLKGRNVRNGKETDSFLSPPLDDFPHSHIVSTVDKLVTAMTEQGVVSLERTPTGVP